MNSEQRKDWNRGLIRDFMSSRECSNCGKSFWTYYEQEKHECDSIRIGNLFVDRKDAEKRTRKWKGDTPKFEHTCNICGKKAYNKFYMQIHCFRIHGIETREEMQQKGHIITKRNW